jgi:16S rRNA (uracil1498-N3)-methyltransferase
MMRRFHLPPSECAAAELLLPPREAHHAAHVLRLARGEQVMVLDGAGLELDCEVAEATRQRVRLAVRQRRQLPPRPWQITLLQAIPKGKILEDIIHKATELGLARLVPLLTERVVIQPHDRGLENRTSRWRQTAIEAMKQSGNPWLPRIEAPLTPAVFVARQERFDLALVGSLLDAPCHIRERFRAYRTQHHGLPRSVGVWIGPEGDFTPAELELARSAGALPISLGEFVLRCETAALYCLSVLHHELTAPPD